MLSHSSVIFRFVFHSDEVVNQEGVVIDDLVVEGATLATPSFDETDIAIYPNPSKNIFNLKTKTIFNFDYFLNITSNGGKLSKKLVLN